MGYSFGKESRRKLNTCHKDLILIHNLAISQTKIDYAIVDGYRSEKKQLDLFQAGKSRADGYQNKNKHNSSPSWATDISIYHPDPLTRKIMTQDPCSFAYVAGVIISCAKQLLEKEFIKHDIRWGGNWDLEGMAIKEQNMNDLVHFELVEIRR